jgi:hypothetical protein
VPRPITEAWAPRGRCLDRRPIARFTPTGLLFATDHVGARARLPTAVGLAILPNRRICHVTTLIHRNEVLFFVAHPTRF